MILILHLFLQLRMRLLLLVLRQRTVSSLTPITSVTASTTTNSQINLMLLTSLSWKVLSTMPSNGSMPLKKVRRRNTKRNKRSLRLLPSTSLPFCYGFGLVTYAVVLALSCKDYMALRVVRLVVLLEVSLAVASQVVLPAVSLVEARMVPAWRRLTKFPLQCFGSLHGIFVFTHLTSVPKIMTVSSFYFAL